MGPSEWRDMRQEFGRTVESSFSPLSDSHPKLLGVPIDDDGGQQVQTRDAEVLTFSGAIADFALPPDPQCALQSMVGLAFVETYLGAALHLGIEQPFDDKQCPFDPPDFAQRKCQVVLSRSRRQFLEEMTGCILPESMVATQRRTSGQLVMMVVSRMRSPVRPFSSFGTACGSKTCNLLEARSRMRGGTDSQAMTWRQKPGR